jgi:hypothetical protein
MASAAAPGTAAPAGALLRWTADRAQRKRPDLAFGLDSQHTGQRWLALRCACSLPPCSRPR